KGACLRHKHPKKPSFKRTSQKTWKQCVTLPETNLRENPCHCLAKNLHPQPRTEATVFFSCPSAIHNGCGNEPSPLCCTALRQTSTVCRHFAARRRPLSRADLFRPHSLPAKEKAARELLPRPPVVHRNGS